jgi:phage repressor protein C with HTH and peptisase S24 domain
MPRLAYVTLSLEKAADGDTFAKRLRLLIGHETVTRFTKRIGIPESSIRNYLAGGNPTSDRLLLLTKATGVSLDWLMTGHGEMYLTDEPKPSTVVAGVAQGWVPLPLYDISAGAGGGAFASEEALEDVIAFREDWVRQYLRTTPAGLNMIHVRGESMEPTLRHGDIIFVDRKIEEPREGIHVIEMEGTLLVKRLVVLPGHRVRVSSDNPAYESFVVDPKEEEFRVIGKVVGSLRAI